jgi:PAS domain S-box-containing protein
MASADATMIVAADGAIACVNAAAKSLLALPQLAPDARLQDFVADKSHVDSALATFSRTGAPLPANFRFAIQGELRELRCNGCAIVHGNRSADTFLFVQFPRRAQANRSFVALNQKIAELNREVVARRRTEALLAGQQEVLRMMLHDAPLADVLRRLCVAVEQQSQGGALASILLLDGDRLRHGAAPSLPEEYCRAIDGVQIGPAAGSCGTAAFRGTPVIVEDIASDPLWADYREAAARAGLCACWSIPVLSSDGRVLATFATYYRQSRKPTAADWQVIDITARAAAVAIERSRVEADRRSREEALRRKDEQLSAALAASATGTYRWNPATNQMPYFDENLARLFGYESDEHLVPPADFHHRIHPDDQAHVIERLLRTRDGSDLDMEYRVVHPDGSTHWLYDRGRYLAEEGCIVGACTDITARKLAEEAVRESEQQFRTMADAIPQLAWMTDPSGYIYWYNRRWYE